MHAFLSLRSLDGKLVAAGDLTQVIRAGVLTLHLKYSFKDGSIDDETAVFTQNGSFRLLRDHHVQKGPIFKHATDVAVEMATGQVTTRSMEDGKLKVETTHMDLPEDLCNGMLINLVKNLTPGNPETKLSFLAATPKPRLVHLSITQDGSESFRSAGLKHNAQRYRIHVELGGITGVIAPVLGKEPADSVVWISGGTVPATIKSESPLFVGGPQLRTEMAGATW